MWACVVSVFDVCGRTVSDLNVCGCTVIDLNLRGYVYVSCMWVCVVISACGCSRVLSVCRWILMCVGVSSLRVGVS